MHMQLEESGSVTTFGTSFGCFALLKMQMRIIVPPEISQRNHNVPGLHIIVDRTGEKKQEDGVTMTQFLDRCRERNIKPNAEKKIRQKKTFIGLCLVADGPKADPEKVQL